MDNIVMHKFSVGQTVNLIPRVLRSAAVGEYEILHLMPAPDADPETPRYRIKNVAEKNARVPTKTNLTLSIRSGPLFSSPKQLGAVIQKNLPSARCRKSFFCG